MAAPRTSSTRPPARSWPIYPMPPNGPRPGAGRRRPRLPGMAQGFGLRARQAAAQGGGAGPRPRERYRQGPDPGRASRWPNRRVEVGSRPTSSTGPPRKAAAPAHHAAHLRGRCGRWCQEPVGVVADTCTMDFPVPQARKLAAALAASYTIIIGAPEATPGSPVGLVRCFHDASVPQSVVNLVYVVPAEVSERLGSLALVRGSRSPARCRSASVWRHLPPRGTWSTTMELSGSAPVWCTTTPMPIQRRNLRRVRVPQRRPVCVSRRASSRTSRL